MQMVAQGWLVVNLTNSPGWLGAVSLSGSLPFLVLPLFGGVIADQIDRVRLLKFTQSISMLLAFVLAALTLADVITVWHVMVLAFLTGIAGSFDQPTRTALVPDLVRREDLMQAISLNSTAFQGAALIGPAIAGLLVGVIGVGGCFLINGFSYLAVIAALFMLRVPEQARATGKSIRNELMAGVRFIISTPLLLNLLLLTVAFSIFGRSYVTLLPAFAKLVLHEEAGQLGLMYAMPGLGTLIGGFALATYGNIQDKGRFLLIVALVYGAAMVLFSLSSQLWLILLILIIVGASNTSYSAMANTLLQSRAPGPMRGRVMSYNTIALIGLTPFGGAIVGGIAEVAGTRAALVTGGLAVAFSALLIYTLLPHLRAAKREEEALQEVAP